jgi:hypothetical protein
LRVTTDDFQISDFGLKIVRAREREDTVFTQLTESHVSVNASQEKNRVPSGSRFILQSTSASGD